mgnify:CR=1 FL=1
MRGGGVMEASVHNGGVGVGVGVGVGRATASSKWGRVDCIAQRWALRLSAPASLLAVLSVSLWARRKEEGSIGCGPSPGHRARRHYYPIEKTAWMRPGAHAQHKLQCPQPGCTRPLLPSTRHS